MDDQRNTMVQTQLLRRGIRDRRVLRAMAAVPRHLFLPDAFADQAYSDQALPLDSGQTISQPFIVALMAQALQLKADDSVLEIGAGSGYAAAVLSKLGAYVYTVERDALLAEQARTRLAALGYHRVSVVLGDGTLGLAAFAPYNAISVAAAAPQVPQALLEQLADGGRFVIPVGERNDQELLRITRQGTSLRTQKLGGVRFVPLVGEQAWSE
jgi:protein-L-isoaspartate(D-aspartate) O-methyltransferase